MPWFSPPPPHCRHEPFSSLHWTRYPTVPLAHISPTATFSIFISITDTHYLTQGLTSIHLVASSIHTWYSKCANSGDRFWRGDVPWILQNSRSLNTKMRAQGAAEEHSTCRAPIIKGDRTKGNWTRKTKSCDNYKHEHTSRRHGLAQDISKPVRANLGPLACFPVPVVLLQPPASCFDLSP